MTVEEQVLDWLIHQVESDEIEDVTDEMLDMLIKRSKHLAVLFCKPLPLYPINFYVSDLIVDVIDNKNEAASLDVLKELENIDDECDQKGVIFVKIDNPDEAKEYGIDVVPSLIYFENTIPSLFVGT